MGKVINEVAQQQQTLVFSFGVRYNPVANRPSPGGVPVALVYAPSGSRRLNNETQLDLKEALKAWKAIKDLQLDGLLSV